MKQKSNWFNVQLLVTINGEQVTRVYHANADTAEKANTQALELYPNAQIVRTVPA